MRGWGLLFFWFSSRFCFAFLVSFGHKDGHPGQKCVCWWVVGLLFWIFCFLGLFLFGKNWEPKKEDGIGGVGLELDVSCCFCRFLALV